MTDVRRKQYYDVQHFNTLNTDGVDLKILHLNIRRPNNQHGGEISVYVIALRLTCYLNNRRARLK